MSTTEEGARRAAAAPGRPAPQARQAARVLGQMLLRAGAVTQAELDAALALQAATRQRLGELLVARGTDPEAVARALAEQLRLAYAEPPLRPEPAALALIGHGVAARLRLLPLAVGERALRVATADPLDIGGLDDLRFRVGRAVEPVVASEAALAEGLAAACDAGTVRALVARLEGRGAVKRSGPSSQELRRASESAPVVAAVDLMLERASESGASDLHVEPVADALRVRARIDGVLREIMTLPASVGPAVCSRLKIMAGLDIAVKRRPQDGRAVLHGRDAEIGLRVSTLPALTGEKVVLRLLRSEGARTLEQLGLAAADRDRLQELLRHPQGVVLVTGPTGSGKTTTLYAALATQDRERRNVVTLEDPVEYRLPGLTQVQVHPRGGVTFPLALRAVLRQDPDVIMVGEMRDRETAEVAMAAAVTGHLVLSTIHTNDAAGAITRLLELGVPPYLIAAGLIGVVAQRLVRRICAGCGGTTRRGAGGATSPDAARCARCEGSGYRGRIGVYEVMLVDDVLRRLILRRAPEAKLRERARAAGMRLLAEDALEKAARGETTPDEVAPLTLGLRVNGGAGAG